MSATPITSATRTVQTSCPLEPSFAYADQVRVRLRDGRCLDSGPIRFARGHAERPLSDQQLLEKLLAKAKKLTTLPEIYARETVLLAKYPPKVKVILQAIRIGELGIVATPCETFVEIGLEVKKQSPRRPTFTIELANGYNGYLPTPEQHQLGGYETWRARSSYLEVNASRRITATVLELLHAVAPTRH